MKVREGYKVTELGLIPDEWEVKSFDDVLTGFTSGSTPSRMISEYYFGDIKWVTSGELEYNLIIDTIEKISREAMINTNLKLHPSGTFLMAITGLEAKGTRGRCAILGTEATTNQSCMALYAKKSILIKYLFYFYSLKSEEYAFTYCQGTKQQSYNAKLVRILPIILPPLQEQQRIAEILSSNDALITKTAELIEKTKEVKQGLMQELLTKGIGHTEFKDSELGRIPKEWEVKKLSEVVNKIIGGGTPSREVAEYFIGDIPWVTVKDLDGAIYKDSAIENISDEAVKNSSANVIDPFNVIVATRMGLGRGFINKVPMAINQDLKALIPLSNINCLYLLFWFLSNEILISSMGTGSTVKGIRLETLRDLLIPVPSIEEQRKIASILINVDNKLEALSKRKQQLEEIKQGLMQDLLTGRVRIV